MKITKTLTNGETLTLETEQENGKTFYRARYSNDPGNAGFEDDRGEIGENETAEEIADRLASWLQENVNEHKTKSTGNVTHTRTSAFQRAVFLNDPSTAYETLDELLGPGGWYPENNMDAWTDIGVEDGKYYAVYGADSVHAENAECIYVQIEPTERMKKEYDYFQQY